MKKIVLAILLLHAGLIMAQSYSGGSGTSGDPYLIANKADLKYLSEHSTEWSKSFKQTADIVFVSADFQSGGDFYNTGKGFSCIGYYNAGGAFTGKYDGDYHVIDGLFMSRATTNDNIGLFGYVANSASISNLGVINANVTGFNETGILVGGTNANGSTNVSITNCYTTGTVTGVTDGTADANFVGGLIGFHWVGAISNCYSTATVNGGWYVGGLIGESDGTVSNCYSRGNVTMNKDYGGGFMGASAQGSITNCYSTGTLTTGTGSQYGGFLGWNYGTVNISNCFWDTQSSGWATSNGGTGKTTTEMKTESTFTGAGWDFVGESTNGNNDYWKILSCANNAYPTLNNVYYTPVADALADVRACASYTLPALSTQNKYFTGSGGTGSQLAAGSDITSTQTVYIYASNDACSDENSFLITIFNCIQLDVASCNSTLNAMGDAITAETASGATRYRFKVTHAGTSYEASTIQNFNHFALSYFVSNPAKYGTTYNVQASAEVGGLWMPFENVCTVTTPATRLKSASCGITLASLSDAIYSEAVANASNYKYEIRKASDNSLVNVSTRGTNDNLLRLSWVSGIANGTVYKIRVSAYVAGSWQAYGPSCEVTTPLITKLATSSCGITLNAMSDALYSDPVAGASDYRYEIRKASDNSLVTVSTRGSNDNLFRMSWITGNVIQVNTDYKIRVAPYVGGVWKDYGASCTIHTTLLTKLAAGSCSGSFLDLNDFMYCEPVAGATDYRYEIRSSPGLTLLAIGVRGSSDNSYRLSWRPEIQLGQAYRVKVAAYVNGSWMPFGPECTIFMYSSMATENNHDEAPASEMTDKKNVLTVFPNPNNGIFTLRANAPGDCQLTNELGQVIQTITIDESGKTDVQLPSAGIYFLKGTETVQKIIVE